MTTAEKLQRLRKEKGISQEKLIKELEEKQGIKIAISSLRNYENVNVQRLPKNEILNALAKYYDVDIEYLMNDEAENITTENIKINEILGLSDMAINQIKKVNMSKMGLKDTLNDFLINIDLEYFIERVQSYNNINEIVKILDSYDFHAEKLSNLHEQKNFLNMFKEVIEYCEKAKNITLFNTIEYIVKLITNNNNKILSKDKDVIHDLSVRYKRIDLSCI